MIDASYAYSGREIEIAAPAPTGWVDVPAAWCRAASPRAGARTRSRWRQALDALKQSRFAWLFARPNAHARARHAGQAGAGMAGAAGGDLAAADRAAPGPAQAAQARTALFEQWRAAGPLAFDALHGQNGSLRRDAVNALWARMEQLLAMRPGGCAAAGDGAPLAAGAGPDDGTLAMPELRALAERLSAAARLLGEEDRDSAERRLVLALRVQVLGAWAALERPDMLREVGKSLSRYTAAGSSRVFSLAPGDVSIPALPLGPSVSPQIGGKFVTGMEVADDLGIAESTSIELRVGIVGRIRAFVPEVSASLSGSHARSKGRGYRDQDHILQAPGSRAYGARHNIPRLKALARAAGHARAGRLLGFSMRDLDRLRGDAATGRDAFAQAAAMLGVVAQCGHAEGAHHPLSVHHRDGPGAGSPIRTAASGLAVGAEAGLSGAPATMSVLGANANAKVGVSGSASRANTAVRTYVPVWDALAGGELERAGEVVTARRLDHLRKAADGLASALHAYQGGPAGRDLARTLDAIAKWTRDRRPVSPGELIAALRAMTDELDLYCHARRLAAGNGQAEATARAIERAWGVGPRQGVYGYMRALAVAAALIGRYARDMQLDLSDEYGALTARLATPALPFDDVLMKRATGFKDTLEIGAWRFDMALDGKVSATLPLVVLGADAGARVKASRIDHFNVLKSGDFVDVEVGIGATASLAGNPLLQSVNAVNTWVGNGLGLAVESLPAGMGDAILAHGSAQASTLASLLKAGGRVIVAMKFSRPLAPGRMDKGKDKDPNRDGLLSGYNLEHIRVSVQRDLTLMDKVTTPIHETIGKHAIRTLLMRVDNCYGKNRDTRDGRARGEAEARAYLAAPAIRRELPDVFESLAKDDSAAQRQVRAFVRTVIEHSAEPDGQRDGGNPLREREHDFFAAIRAYAQCKRAAGRADAGPAQDGEPLYAAAVDALLALVIALRGPARHYRDKRTVYATEQGKLRRSA